MKNNLRSSTGDDSTENPFPRTMTGHMRDSSSTTTTREAGESAFPRTMTGQFLRTLTITGVVNEEWGRDAIEEIEKIGNKGRGCLVYLKSF
jgi:hypothetical protein